VKGNQVTDRYPEPVAVRWLSDDEQAVWRRLLRVHSHLQYRLDQELRAASRLSLSEYEVLVHLSEAGPFGARMSDLADRLLLSRSGLTRRIDAMVRSGLVERGSCPEDGRGAMARLTELGAARLADSAPTHVAGVRRYLIDVLDGELSGLSAGLARIEAALGLPGGDEGCAQDQPGSSPSTTSPPRSIQPLVPPATETAL
jgi:DNA-binding MarR family transcriptional regulator